MSQPRLESLEDRLLLSSTPQMLKDIFPAGSSSNPGNLVAMNDILYFTANDGTHGEELWKSDGTAAGTSLVKDIRSGSSGSTITNMLNLNGTLFFQANDGSDGGELWKSDGTTAGTTRVKDIIAGGFGSGPANLTRVSGTLFFTANDGVTGIELWRSDGTTAGTTLVKDIRSGSTGSLPSKLTAVNGKLLFTADDGTNGVELWQSDGTTAGTTLVMDINSGSSGSSPQFLTDTNGTLFFQANDSINRLAFWKSDGTSAGTVLVKSLVEGSGSLAPSELTNVNGAVFFRGTNLANGPELWKSDGTTAGTVLVKDIKPGFGGSSPGLLTNVNGTVYLAADDGTNGIELWKSDGTTAGTTLVRNIRSGSANAGPDRLTNVNGTLFFRAFDDATGFELWTSDGTSADTTLVMDINPGSVGSSPSNLANVNGRLFFSANDGVHGNELWILIPNEVPAIASNSAAVSANEGGTASNSGTFFDPQGNATVIITASIGTVTQNNTAGTWSWSINAADGPVGPVTVTITATDNQAAAANTTFTYAVNNVAPSISLSGDATVNEGSLYTLNLGVVTDPGQDTITRYEINWGDGAIDTFTGNPANTTATHTYADGPSAQTHTVTVTDEDGAFLAGSLSVMVLNVSPTLALSGASNVDEGSPYTLNLASSDPGDDTITSWLINWDDGNTQTVSGNPVSVSHFYADGPISYTILATADDEDGTYGANSLGVMVDNVAPTATFFNDGAVDEGSTGNASFSNQFDTSTADTSFHYSYDFDNDGTFEIGDGTYAGSGTADSTTVPASFLADGPGTRTVRGRILDDDGGFTEYTTTITFNNVAPVANADGPYTVVTQGTVTLNGSGSDPAGALDTLSYEWDLDGDGLFGEAGPAADRGAENLQNPTFSAANLDGPTTYTVALRVRDDDGGLSSISTATINVTNVQPTANVGGPYTVEEGGSIVLDATGSSDPDQPGNTLTYDWDFDGDDQFESYAFDFNGDGQVDDVGASPTFYADSLDGPSVVLVRLRVTDNGGLTSTDTASVIVSNVAPTATLGTGGAANEGSTGTVSFLNQADASSADATAGFKYSYDFNNDGTFETVDSNSASATVPATDLTDGPSTRTVNARIKDKDGGFTDYTTTITINNMAPTATLSNGGAVNEGSTGSVSFSNQADASSADTTAGFKYSYDFDNDGVFETVNSNSASAVPATYLTDGPSTRTVKARINDQNGGFTDYTTTITINNVAPRAVLNAPIVVETGVSSDFSLSNASDPSGADTSAEFHYSFAFDGKVTSLATTYADADISSTASHSFPVPGTYTVKARVFDKNDAFNTYTANVLVTQTTQFGAGVDDFTRGVAADATGVYVVGYTAGTFSGQTNAGKNDGFVRKYDTTGSLLWTSQFGTAENDYAQSVAVGASGVYVVGTTNGTISGPQSLGSGDAFVRKYTTSGNLLWTMQFGSTAYDVARNVAVDTTGVYVVGATYGTFSGQTSAGSVNAFVRKLDTNGTTLWTSQFGSAEYDSAQSVAVDASGVYVVGTSDSFFSFVRKYSTTGSPVWTNQFGTMAPGFAQSVAVDATGVYVAGYIPGDLAFSGQTSAGGSDGFLRKYNTTGDLLWTRQFGSAGGDYPWSVAVDASEVYVAGYTDGALSNQASAGGSDAFVRKYDANGNALSTSQFGSGVGDFAQGLAVNASDLYLVGYTDGALSAQAGTGGSDAFVSKHNSTGDLLWTRQFGSGAAESVQSVAVDNTFSVFVVGNTTGTFAGQSAAGGADAFVRSYPKIGPLPPPWTRQFGSSGTEFAKSVAVDTTGVYVVGFTTGTIPLQPSAGRDDAFVRKYTRDGGVLWTRQFGSAGSDYAQGAAVDATGVYVVGYTDGIFSGQANAGGSDVIVRKYDTNGRPSWTTQFGSTGSDYAQGVAVDTTGVYVVGNTNGTFSGQTGAGGLDAFLTKMVVNSSYVNGGATAVNGYLVDGTAFFDANRNGEMDPTEPWTLTDSTRRFEVQVPSVFDSNDSGTLDDDEGQWVVTGGTDTSTGLPAVTTLVAPASWSVVTPLTTLVSTLAANYALSLPDATNRVRQALGLPDVDLSSLDPIAQTIAGDPLAPEVFAVHARVQDTIAQSVAVLEGAGAGATADLARAMIDVLAARIVAPDSNLDFSDAAVIGAILHDAESSSGITIDANVLDGAAVVIAATNQLVAAIPVTSDIAYLAQVAQVKTVSQGAIVEQLTLAAQGDLQIGTVVAQNTGDSLAAQVTSAATPPTVVVPTQVLAEASSAAGALVDFNVTATNLAGQSLPVTCDSNSGDQFPMGTTTVNCSANEGGVTGQASFNVTVADTIAPTLALPANLIVQADLPDGVLVTLDLPLAVDLVDPNPVVLCDASSGFFPVGVTLVTCTAADAAGNVSNVSFTIQVVSKNPPTADAGGPYTVGEGGSVQLDASNSVDPEQDNTTLTYQWDLDGDNILGEVGAAAGRGDETGMTPTFSAAGLDGPSSVTVALRVTDNGGLTSTDTAIVSITNVAPVVAPLGGLAAGVRGQTLAYSGSFSDPGADTWAASVNYGDGSGDQPLALTADKTFNFSHVYIATGAYTITVTVRDDDGDLGTSTQVVSIARVVIEPDPSDPTKAFLVIGGTLGADRIKISPKDDAGAINVKIRFDDQDEDESRFRAVVTPPPVISRIIVFGQAGDDDIHVIDGITIPAELHGDAGNDRIKGGGGNDILIGGDGDDLMVGGNGRDLMIGGYGADRLVGNAEEDILIAGATVYDNNDLALRSIMQEWTSAGSNGARTANIMAGTGLAGGFKLDGNDGANQTVFNDNNADTLTGSQGVDWFFANQIADNGGVLDTITDRAANELWNDTDF